jgi:hypothetical protein
VLGGAVEVFPARLEAIGVFANAAVAERLRASGPRAELRVGFFLAFDDPDSRPCLVRPSVGVTTVRMDVAFVELVSGNGRVVARQDTDRLRAWLDDAELDGVPGSGPRGMPGAASRTDGAGIAPEAWQRALAASARGPVGAALGRCHADGLSRRAVPDGRVVVRLVVDARRGVVSSSEVELSSVGDDQEAECIARALSRVVLPADASLGASVTISVPVRLAN